MVSYSSLSELLDLGYPSDLDAPSPQISISSEDRMQFPNLKAFHPFLPIPSPPNHPVEPSPPYQFGFHVEVNLASGSRLVVPTSGAHVANDCDRDELCKILNSKLNETSPCPHSYIPKTIPIESVKLTRF